jgi:hypothetical protein
MTVFELNKEVGKALSNVFLQDNLKEIPDVLYSFKDSLQLLDLSNNLLETLPGDFYVFEKLEILFLSNNQLTVLPKVLYKCKSLRLIGIKSNKIKSIPENSLPKSLQWLTLADNEIESIPKSIGDCTLLQKLILSGNKIKSVPNEIVNCKNLELIRLASNQLEQFPEVLLDLPKLTWLAYSGNPFSQIQEEIVLPKLDWTDFQLKEELGNGASGVIHKVVNTKKEEFALKVFKSGMTSDGSPFDELYHYAKVGNHPNLVSLKGDVTNFEEEKKAVLFDLIPNTYSNLGNSPSLVSCTRDVMSIPYDFSFSEVLHLLKSIASVSCLMHEKGVMHGDLYAHNILVQEGGACFLCDFGAACSYDDVLKDNRLEKIEIRAFGVLIEDVLKVSNVQVQEEIELSSIKKKCLKSKLEERPDFKKLSQLLNQL